jgi:hypothetical protein
MEETDIHRTTSGETTAKRPAERHNGKLENATINLEQK